MAKLLHRSVEAVFIVAAGRFEIAVSVSPMSSVQTVTHESVCTVITPTGESARAERTSDARTSALVAHAPHHVCANHLRARTQAAEVQRSSNPSLSGEPGKHAFCDASTLASPKAKALINKWGAKAAAAAEAPRSSTLPSAASLVSTRPTSEPMRRRVRQSELRLAKFAFLDESAHVSVSWLIGPPCSGELTRGETTESRSRG